MSATSGNVDAELRRDGDELGAVPRLLRPFIDAVARIPATVHAKLLAGFLVIAVLLLSMGVISVPGSTRRSRSSRRSATR
jgi:hypothetical protein